MSVIRRVARGIPKMSASASSSSAAPASTSQGTTTADRPPASSNKPDARPRVYEGVFAINKPGGMSSAQVLRELQAVFNPSKLFAPWLAAERERLTWEASRQGRKPKRRQTSGLQVKMGHGGTLDPMATGVLIVGVGKGTKSLQSFINCTKSYRTTLLFGAATDTYDAKGKVLGRAQYAHVTREKVEQALGQFRGEIWQTPPIYSALHMDGKRLYEYAREGKELPREIEKRKTRVDQLEITEWLPAGSHEHTWPADEAPAEERRVTGKVLHLEEVPGVQVEEKEGADAEPGGIKRKRDAENKAETSEQEQDLEPASKKARDDNDPSSLVSTSASTSPLNSNRINNDSPSSPLPSPPAVQLNMTVSSGFYVRSLCHDLGQAVGSLGLMSTLVRTRQGDFALDKDEVEGGVDTQTQTRPHEEGGDGGGSKDKGVGNLNLPVLPFSDLARGEDVWGEKVRGMLEAWMERNE